jgi:hypothetical protein
MTEQQLGVGDTGFRDRRVGLIGWGIFQILLGGLCLLFMVVMAGVMALSGTIGKNGEGIPGAEPRMMVPALLVYGVLAAWWITMGIGSIRARRWARAIIAATAWIALIGGLMGILFMVFLMPDMYGSMAKSGQIPVAMARVMQVVMLGFMALFYIIIPGLVLLFYSTRDCRATCEARDPRPCWTDALPTSLLAVTMMFWIWAASVPVLGCYGWFFPFFGTILTGLAGMAAVLVSAVLCAATAWGLGRRKIEAWAGALLLTAAWSVSGYLTFRNMTLMDLYRHMNFPEEQLRVMEQMALPGMPAMMVMYAVGIAVLFGILFFVRRYFVRPA